MKSKSRRLPSLEPLEDRCVPATVRLISGTLYISNPTIVGTTTNVTVTQTAANTFSVTDGASNNGTYANVSNINYTGSNAADRFTLNLNGLTYTGSLLANAGNGNDSVTVNNGNMRGNLQVFPGSGNDSVGLGNTAALTVGGTTQVTDTAGNDSITLGNATAASNFQGSVSLQGLNTINVANGAADTYGSDFTASTTVETLPLNFLTANGAPAVTINGNLQLTGGPSDDTVVLSSLVVNKSVNVNLAGALTTTFGNTATEQSSGPALQVGGSFTYTGGSGADYVALPGVSVNNNLTLNLGDGPDVVDLNTAGGLFASPTVGGDLDVNGGNGDINLNGFFGEGITATVFGSMNFNLGSGNDSATIVHAPGVRLNWTSGNGSDSVTLGAATTFSGEFWNVNFHFGTGSDTLTLSPDAPATQYITGFVDMGGPAGGNVFDPFGETLPGGNWQIVQPWTLQNV